MLSSVTLFLFDVNIRSRSLNPWSASSHVCFFFCLSVGLFRVFFMFLIKSNIKYLIIYFNFSFLILEYYFLIFISLTRFNHYRKYDFLKHSYLYLFIHYLLGGDVVVKLQFCFHIFEILDICSNIIYLKYFTWSNNF